MRLLLDSSAWIEYILGSSKGEEVFEILKQNQDEIYSLSLILAEVVSKFKREKQDFSLAFRIISSNSRILEVSPEIAKEAGLLHAEAKKKKRNFGLIDAIIWTVAKKLNAKLVTCDSHFKSFKNVILLK